MKHIGSLIVAISVCLAAVAATTAYTPVVNPTNEALLGLHLTQPAGARTPAPPDNTLRPVDSADAIGAEPAEPDAEGATPKPVPLLSPADVGEGGLTRAHLELLDAAGVKRVQVKEFRFGLWTHSWMMGLGLVGLVAGALLVKTDARRKLGAQRTETSDPKASPALALKGIEVEVGGIFRELEIAPSDAERTDLIVQRVGSIQETHVDAILNARQRLTARLGLSGFAVFMDRFSALERQLNRAWSAAADGHLPEARASLERARELAPLVGEGLDL